jgi:hypothetical protein
MVPNFVTDRDRAGILSSHFEQVVDILPEDIAPRVKELLADGIRRMFMTDLLVIEITSLRPENPMYMAIQGAVEIADRQYRAAALGSSIEPVLYAAQLLLLEWIDYLDRSKMIEVTTESVCDAIGRLPTRLMQQVGIGEASEAYQTRAHALFLPPLGLH